MFFILIGLGIYTLVTTLPWMVTKDYYGAEIEYGIAPETIGDLFIYGFYYTHPLTWLRLIGSIRIR